MCFKRNKSLRNFRRSLTPGITVMVKKDSQTFRGTIVGLHDSFATILDHDMKKQAVQTRYIYPKKCKKFTLK